MLVNERVSCTILVYMNGLDNLPVKHKAAKQLLLYAPWHLETGPFILGCLQDNARIPQDDNARIPQDCKIYVQIW